MKNFNDKKSQFKKDQENQRRRKDSAKISKSNLKTIPLQSGSDSDEDDSSQFISFADLSGPSAGPSAGSSTGPSSGPSADSMASSSAGPSAGPSQESSSSRRGRGRQSASRISKSIEPESSYRSSVSGRGSSLRSDGRDSWGRDNSGRDNWGRDNWGRDSRDSSRSRSKTKKSNSRKLLNFVTDSII